jgi:hypothetical protein
MDPQSQHFDLAGVDVKSDQVEALTVFDPRMIRRGHFEQHSVVVLPEQPAQLGVAHACAAQVLAADRGDHLDIAVLALRADIGDAAAIAGDGDVI